MKIMKILSIFGTRPEAIKMAPVVKELEKRAEIQSITCVTAQHRAMLDQVLEAFEILPNYDLDIMAPNQTLADITSKALIKIGEVLKTEKPDLVLVHGDTTTAMAGALAAFYQQIPVGHVEAGLRTYDKYSPFPEEINRQIIDNVADLLFAPTEESKLNITGSSRNAGQKIFVTGNTAIDALATTVKEDYEHPILNWAKDSRLILVTAHRRENLGRPMRNFFTAMRQVAEEFPEVKIVYPVHLNPLVQEAAHEILDNHPQIRLIEPLDVLDFHNFMKAAEIILSDSGGVQEEAPALGKPVLVLRNTTERPEGVQAGTLKLVGTETEKVRAEIVRLLTDKAEYERMASAKNPYGDGKASKYIVDAIINSGEINEKVQ